MSELEFDPQSLAAQATGLYDAADATTRLWTVLGVGAGLALGSALATPATWTTVGMVVMGGALGALIGHDRARQLRLDAQLALLHGRIETHTGAWVVESRLALRRLADALDRMNRLQAMGVVVPPMVTEATPSELPSQDEVTADEPTIDRPVDGRNGPDEAAATVWRREAPDAVADDDASPQLYQEAAFYEGEQSGNWDAPAAAWTDDEQVGREA